MDYNKEQSNKIFFSKKNIIITIVIIVTLGVLSGGGYYFWKSQESKFLNFKDPKLTNQELADAESRIKDLEGKVATQEQFLDPNNKDKKADLFKVEMSLAANYRLRGRLLDAKKMVEKASKLLPENISSYNELYVINFARTDYNSAEQNLKQALKINPANTQAWRWYFELAENNLSYSKPQLDDLYKQALEKSTQNVDIISLYAAYLEKNNDLVGAVNQWKKAIEINPAGNAIYQAEIKRIQDKLK